MTNKIYVGNFPYSVTEQSLEQLFAPFGAIESLTIIKDWDTGRSKGFAFIAYDSSDAANKAVKEMNGHMLGERPLKVNIAEERKSHGSDRDRRGRG